MPNDIAIAVHNVSKRYHVYENQRARLQHAFWPKTTAGVSEIWALRDVSFEVKKSDAVGIIGRNGSGKSTLLEIITGTLKPTTGQATVNGRIAALLELGSGFNPEYTGRENVFLNGLLMGLTRAEVEARFDDIASFADIGDVLDRPVKTYSSGMLVRLAFAVQVALEPDILIVDEALSVGDYFFQQKCFGRLRQMREDGLTLLFVSHDMGTVRNLCSQAVYLRKGDMQIFGDSKEAIRRYLAEDENFLLKTSEHNEAEQLPQACSTIIDDLDVVRQSAHWHKVANCNSDRLLAVTVHDAQGEESLSVRMGEKVTVSVYLRAQPDDQGHLSLLIKNKYDQVVSNISSFRLGMPAISTEGAHFGIFEFCFDCCLEAGLYSFMVNYGRPGLPNRGQSIESTPWLGPLCIAWDYENDHAPFIGMFQVPYQGRFIVPQKIVLKSNQHERVYE